VLCNRRRAACASDGRLNVTNAFMLLNGGVGFRRWGSALVNGYLGFGVAVGVSENRFWVSGCGFRVPGCGSMNAFVTFVAGFGLRVAGFGFQVAGFGVRVPGPVWGFGCGAPGLGFLVWGFGVWDIGFGG
jgi:hypothetical protein